MGAGPGSRAGLGWAGLGWAHSGHTHVTCGVLFELLELRGEAVHFQLWLRLLVVVVVVVVHRVEFGWVGLDGVGMGLGWGGVGWGEC